MEISFNTFVLATFLLGFLVGYYVGRVRSPKGIIVSNWKLRFKHTMQNIDATKPIDLTGELTGTDKEGNAISVTIPAENFDVTFLNVTGDIGEVDENDRWNPGAAGSTAIAHGEAHFNGIDYVTDDNDPENAVTLVAGELEGAATLHMRFRPVV